AGPPAASDGPIATIPASRIIEATTRIVPFFAYGLVIDIRQAIIRYIVIHFSASKKLFSTSFSLYPNRNEISLI
ncbi:MAG TPA: hypothetical protein VIH27_04560, partial [Nitrososphaerales archaeon]